MLSLSRTRQDVWVFLALLALFSSAFYALVLFRPDAGTQWSVYAAAFMWCPGMAAIVTCLVRDGTLRGLGWGWGRTRFYPIAYGLALAVCLLPYVVVWVAFDAFDGRQLAGVLREGGPPAGAGRPRGRARDRPDRAAPHQPRQRGWRGDRLAGIPRPADARPARLHRHEPARRSHLGGVALSDQRRGLPAPSAQRPALVRLNACWSWSLDACFTLLVHRRRVHAHVAPAPSRAACGPRRCCTPRATRSRACCRPPRARRR